MLVEKKRSTKYTGILVYGNREQSISEHVRGSVTSILDLWGLLENT